MAFINPARSHAVAASGAKNSITLSTCVTTQQNSQGDRFPARFPTLAKCSSTNGALSIELPDLSQSELCRCKTVVIRAALNELDCEGHTLFCVSWDLDLAKSLAPA